MSLHGRTAWALCLLLIISLSINAFIAGGWIMRDKKHTFLPLSHTLSADVSRDVRQKVKAHREAMRPHMAEVRETRRQIKKLLRQDPLPKAELDQAFGQLRDKNLVIQQDLHGLIIEVAADLPPEARAHWLPKFDRPMGRPPRP